MNISDEAVEAAAVAAHDVAVMWKWSEMNRDESREFFTAILEAAAPHMLAEAWEQAMKQAAEIAWEHDASASSAIADISNPYRSQA